MLPLEKTHWRWKEGPDSMLLEEVLSHPATRNLWKHFAYFVVTGSFLSACHCSCFEQGWDFLSAPATPLLHQHFYLPGYEATQSHSSWPPDQFHDSVSSHALQANVHLKPKLGVSPPPQKWRSCWQLLGRFHKRMLFTPKLLTAENNHNGKCMQHTFVLGGEEGWYRALSGFWHFKFGLSEVKSHSDIVSATSNERV